MKILLDNGKTINIPDTNYKGGGGEGKVYFYGGDAYKIYHDPKNKMIPVGKIMELAKIKADNVLGPKSVIRDPATQDPIGFSMKYLEKNGFLCWLFNTGYKNSNNISVESLNNIVKKMRDTFISIHSSKCLIGDPNEMNFLISEDHTIPYFIDVDAYQTPSYKGPALCKSVADMTVPFGVFTEKTDWFGFAIVTFQLYIGIHPYKGRNPNYSDRQIVDFKMMEDNISVFHKGVTLPRQALPLTAIPPIMCEWYKDVFVNKNREIPPIPDQAAIVVAKETSVKATSTINAEYIVNLPERAIELVNIYSQDLAICKENIYNLTGGVVETLVKNYDYKLLPIEGKFTYALVKGTIGKIKVYVQGKEIGELYSSLPVMTIGKHIYCTYNRTVYKHKVIYVGSNPLIYSEQQVTVFEGTAKVFPGIILQDILGKCFAAIPFDQERLVTVKLDVLDKHRIIDAKLCFNEHLKFALIISEESGIYYRTKIQFKNDLSYTHSTEECDANERACITMLPNGIGVSIKSDEKLEIFRDISSIKFFNDIPFDSSNGLYTSELKVLLIDGRKVFHISTK